jgi:alpha-tubulin suppressor-like RCC1 family protein
MLASVPYIDFGHTIPAVSVATGALNSCAIFANGRATCWGHNNYGQNGQDTNQRSGQNVANPVSDLGFIQFPLRTGDNPGPATAHARVSQIAMGRHHACALLEGGAISCFGRNTWGQIGRVTAGAWGDNTGEIGAGLVTMQFADTVPAVQIDAGNHHTCAVFANGGARCWGLNSNGQLGLVATSTFC